MDYYLPDYKLHMPVSNMQNDNKKEQIEATRNKLLQQLSNLEAVPSVQMKRAPEMLVGECEEDEDDDDYDVELRKQPTRRHHLAEFYDDDDVAGDRMDADRLGGLDSYDEPPDACSCAGACNCRPPNPFVASLTNGGSRFN